MTNETRTAGIVVYLRCRPADRVTSDAAVFEQRAMLTAWIEAQAALQHILAEFIEEEGEGVGRPALAAAIAYCKAQRATLVILSTQPIGTGQVFEPRIASVAVIVLPQPKRSLPFVIPLPAKSKEDVSLYIGAICNGQIPVYLCNPQPIAMTDIVVTTDGLYTDLPKDMGWIPVGGPAQSFARIEPLKAQLIEVRNVMNEGESADRIRIRFNRSGDICEGVAYLSKLFDSRFIRLDIQPGPSS